MKTVFVKSPTIIRYEYPKSTNEIVRKQPLIKKYKHRISPTSMLAYINILENLGEKQRIVYQAIRSLKSANNYMIANHLSLKINQVTGRVFELREFGVVRENKRDTCPETGQLTSFWKVVRELK